jgi:hypothetical protein
MRLTLIILLAASIASAADRPKVVVVPFSVGEGASDSAATKFTRLVNEELKTRDDVMEVVAAPAMKAAPAEKPAAAKKSAPSPEAVAALESGKKALADLRFDEAIVALKKGIDLSLADPATADYPAVLEAYISLGVSAFRQGDEKEATSALFHLARLDPNYQLPAGYPPVFGREFEKAKKKVDKQVKGSLSVEGPPGSTAFVDGRDLGMLPVLEENLAPGAHYVKVEGSRGERFGQMVEVKNAVAKVRAAFAGSAAAASRDPAALANPAVGRSVDDALAGRLTTWAKSVGADYALVGIIYRTGDQQLTAGTALYSARKQGFSALPSIGFDSDVLTANVEAYKLADALQDKIASFTFSSLPIALVTKSVKASGSSVTTNVGDVAAVVADRKAVKPKGDAEKTMLTPSGGEVRALERKSNFVDTDQKPDEPPPTEVKSSGGVPAWVWVVAGVGVAAGAGVGGFFVYKEVSRPVTGTVTATW